MKKTILTGVMILAIGLTYSCGNQADEKHDSKQTEKTEKTVKTDEHHSTESEVVLDNGKLWTANAETTTGINNMIKLMNSFTEKENVEAYAKLTEKLKEEFVMIIQKCSMTGEAHNQLHNYVLPIKDLFKTLSSSDLKKCQESYDKLNKHLKEYKRYFK
ncbi:MAG: hypothetical protein L3J41_08665 [Melioribacteraceae bacterium]|nr:hypothetical protein [Melioribacteraceae bacterium]